MVEIRRHVAQRPYSSHPHYILGLDLGQANDFSALAVTERVLRDTGPAYPATTRRNRPDLRGSHMVNETRAPVKNEILVRHLGRPPLRTPYTEVVDGVIERIQALLPRSLYGRGGSAVLVVDGTGVGRGVIDLLYNRLQNVGEHYPEVSLWPVTITGGTGRASANGGFINLPKQELIFTGGVIPLQDGRLRWGPGIPDRKTLEAELGGYRKKVNIATANTQFEPWRDSEQDDLLFALCLAG
jgi:hypothetical protein